MFSIEIINRKDDIETLSNRLVGSHKLPKFMFLDERYECVVIKMKEGVVPVGLAYGIVERGADVFFLHFLCIKKEYRTYKTILHMLRAVFKAAISMTGAKSAVWKFVLLNESEKNARIKFVEDISFCRIRELKSSKQLMIKMENIDYIRKFVSYRPQLWKEKGYGVVRWSECGDGLRNILREREKLASQDERYMSPLIDRSDCGWVIDENNSFVLTKNNTTEPMGWIICDRISEDEVMIRQFYVYKNERVNVIAHSFATYVLDEIARIYKYLWFDIANGNRQMEMITRKYFDPIVEKSITQCSLVIDFTEVGDVP